MKIGDKVIITGGTPKDWLKYGKPYYTNSILDNNVSKAYKNIEIVTICETEIRDGEEVFDLITRYGDKLIGFNDWEIISINVEQ
ncbi:hypothetical protein DW886_14880 [Enterocloster aldenensis]|uniref:hypothetical protein n=1 Tax=Enterocloster aldenensis TaxID=358742 RepID=UPI000E49FB5C|nr:hypothetical protein DW886_14880 [Enterocloster aldenensis]